MKINASRAFETVHELEANGVDACMFGDADYPSPLNALRGSAFPAVLFMWGNRSLLGAMGVGMCGSRDASPKGLDAATTCGHAVAEHDLAVISGYARGVDTNTHLAALSSGGQTVVVLAEGIRNFRRKRAFNEVPFDEDHVLVLSQFAPSQKWNVGSAMTRNGIICALGQALVVIEAQEAGGTFNAGLQAIELGRPVLALEFSESTLRGNELLFDKGAIAIRNRNQLSAALDDITERGDTRPKLF